MDPIYSILRPILFQLDAERAHNAAIRWAAFVSRHPGLLRVVRARFGGQTPPSLAVKVFGLDLANPVGLAAGLDKNGEAIDFWAALGFGFVEVGTVTPGDGQPGNEPPRLERIIPEKAIVNRMGFNNKGAGYLAKKLAARSSKIPTGANLGKAKVTPNDKAVDDYEAGLRAVWHAADYLVLNVSSPNTPNLRDLQAVESLGPLLSRVRDVNAELAEASSGARRPVLLKIAPDLADEDVDAVADLARGSGIDGLIATNTTVRHDLLRQKPTIAGGLSGPPLAPRALALTRRLYRRVGGELPIVGVGGIRTADDAYERIRAGASLVQVYTGLIYEGPGLVREMLEGLAHLLERDGLESISKAVGADA